MFSAANDILPPLMPSLRPQHRRSNRAVGATLMRSANQFNNARRLGTDAQGKDGVWKARGKPNDAKRMRLPRIGRRGTYAPHSGGATGTSHARAGAATRASCAWAGTARSCMRRTRENTALPRTKRGGARMRCAGTPRPASPLTSPTTPKRNTQEWQDSRVVHDSRGQCSEKGPSLARSARYAFPKGGLRGFSDTWRAYLAKASSFWIHGGDMLPGRGAFSCPRPLLGCMKRNNCHGLPPENAPWRHGVGRRRTNETSTNSTPRADASKKP